MHDEQFHYDYLAIALMVSFALIFGLIVLIVVLSKKRNKQDEEKTKKPLSPKQQRYIESLRGNPYLSPYNRMFYIGESAYNAFAEFIEEVFGYKKDSIENHHKIQYLISKQYIVDFKVLPDGHPDIIWPLTNTSNFHRDRYNGWRSYDRLMDINDKTCLFFINGKNDLSKILECYFKKANIEIHTLSRLKPFSANTNKYVFLDPSSKEYAITYYLIRDNLKMKDALGIKNYYMPTSGSFKAFQEKAKRKYRFQNEKEFMKSLIGHLFSADQIYASFVKRERPLVEELAQAFNYDRSDAGIILAKYRKIENEIRIELFGSKMKTYKMHLKRFGNKKSISH